MIGKTLASALICLVVAAPPLNAQAGEQGKLAASASLRLRGEAWSWFDVAPADGTYQFAAALARVALAQQRARVSWRLELSAPLLLALPDDAVAPAPAGQLGMGATYWAANDSSENVASVFLKQAFIRVGAQGGRPGAAVRLGRFEFIDGSEVAPADATLAALKRDRIAHRLIGNFGFSHVQRSMDGLHVTFDRPRWHATALFFKPTVGAFDADGWSNLDVPVGYLSLNSRAARSDARLFLIGYNDRRRVVKVDNRPAAVRIADRDDLELWTAGGHYITALQTAGVNLDLLFWGALQGGDWGALEHGAHAFALEAGVQPSADVPLRPWLRFGYNRASGDADAADDEHGTFFQVLPTPRIYARFPLYNLMNSEDAFASLILRPSARVSLRGDARVLRLADSADLWYGGGGAFEKESFGYAGRPANARSGLATLYDLSAEFRPSPRVSVTGYMSYAAGKGVIRSIYPADRSATFGYLEVEVRK